MSLKHTYVAKGTYGCVFKPSIPCNNKKLYPNSISKIFHTPGASSDEINETNKIKAINSGNEFTVPLLDQCKIKSKSIDSSELLKCGPKYENKSVYEQIIYGDGGDNLGNIYIETEAEFFDVLYKFKNIMKGIIKIRDTGKIHCDIKPDNIVYNKDTKRLYLIDFGLMMDETDIYKPDKSYILSHPYHFYPPEFQIYFHKTYANESPTIDNILLNYDINRSKIDKIMENLNLIFNEKIFNLDVDYDFLDHFMNDVNSYDEITNLTKRKIDIYCIGVSILFFINDYLGKTNDKNIKLVSSMLKWVNEVVQVNMYKRPTDKEAYKKWEIICSKPPEDESNSNNSLSRKTRSSYMSSIKSSLKKTAKFSKSIASIPSVKVPTTIKIPTPKIPTTIKILTPKIPTTIKISKKKSKTLKNNKKLCPDDKVLNPKTNRCVKKDGKIGKDILKGKIPKSIPKKSKDAKICLDDKVLNPKTNRCVKKDGKIGKNILPDQVKKCPENKILNPATNMCVKKTGKIGKKLI